MSTPVFLRENYESDAAFRRAVRDATNRLLRDKSIGTTAQRPPNPIVGQEYKDTTLSKTIVWWGSSWKDASGTAV